MDRAKLVPHNAGSGRRAWDDLVVETGRESEVVAVFVAWLDDEGWEVQTEVDWADVVAERGDERLVGEVKGITTDPGLDLDTLFGQLLRRMKPGQATRYVVVVPESLVPVASRVPREVRARLHIDLYGVDMDDTVRQH